MGRGRGRDVTVMGPWEGGRSSCWQLSWITFDSCTEVAGDKHTHTHSVLGHRKMGYFCSVYFFFSCKVGDGMDSGGVSKCLRTTEEDRQVRGVAGSWALSADESTQADLPKAWLAPAGLHHPGANKEGEAPSSDC